VTTTPPALYLALLRSRRLRPTPLFRIETIRNTKSTPRALQTLRFGFRHLPFPPINTASVRFYTRLHCCFRLVFIVNNFPFCNVLVRRPAGNGSADLKGFILLTRNQESASHILVIHLLTEDMHTFIGIFRTIMTMNSSKSPFPSNMTRLQNTTYGTTTLSSPSSLPSLLLYTTLIEIRCCQRLNHACAFSKSGSKYPIGILKHAIFQTDDNELTALKPCFN